MTTKRNEKSLLREDRKQYRWHLFQHLPLYTTRLVRERDFTFPTREQLCSPEDVAAVLQEYFHDRDREEFLVCMLDPVMWD